MTASLLPKTPLQYYPRESWGANPVAPGTARATPWAEVSVHHTISRLPAGASLEAEIALIQGIDRYHREDKNWGGIGYNFVVSQNGHIFEGRGWFRIGTHTGGNNSRAFGVAFLTDASRFEASAAAWQAAALLLRESVSLGAVVQGYKIKGHRDYKATACPGAHIYVNLHRLSYDAVRGVGASGPAPPKLATAATAATAAGRSLLRFGARGEEVRALQAKLGMPSRLHTGNFLAKTHEAVLRFQERHGLRADGIVGPQTWALLERR